MNLIDILGQILNIKNEIRDIVEENNDLSRYPTAMNNWLVDRYNEGYTVGYKAKRFALDGSTVTPTPPRTHKSFDDYIPDTYYTSYDYDNLVDIMSWVLNVRKLMKDEDILDTVSDYFPEYPELLTAMYNDLYDLGLQDGEADATSDVYPDVEVHTPELNYSPNTFTLSTDQTDAVIEFKIGDNGAVNRYTREQTITEDVRLWYWAKIGNSSCERQYSDLTFDASVSPGDDVVLPAMCEINQKENKNEITISCETPGASIYYTLWEQHIAVVSNKLYTGSVITFNNSNTVIEAIAQNENGYGPKNTYRPYYYQNQQTEPTEPTQVATPVINYDEPEVTISCVTNGATISYSFNNTDWYTYTEPFDISITRIVYAIARKTGLDDSYTTSRRCEYTGTTPATEKVATPVISFDNNVITVTCATADSTIYISSDNISYNTYSNPITITNNTTFYAKAVKTGMIDSDVTSGYYEYINPESPKVCMPVICSVVTLENRVTLSCETEGAMIHYKLMTNGTYNDVSSPYTFVLDGQYDIYEIYCYSSKTSWNDSEMRSYTIPYYRVVTKPTKPVINLSDDGTVTIYTISTDATLYYKYGVNGEWQTQETDVDGRHENQITIQPTGDCAIYAKCTLDGIDSDIAGPLQYTWLTDTYDLDPPEITRTGDRVYMSANNTIWYTINGGDPRSGGRTWSSTTPIYITEAGTVIKACCIDSIDGKTHYSEVVTKVWSPADVGDDPVTVAGTHFWVKGASTITVNTNGYTGICFSWSYDKMTWNNVNSAATGIDSSRTVYLQGSNGGRAIWDHMNFGSTDSVTIGGNIMSLLYGNNFNEQTAVTQESTFREMFSGATTLIDASELNIPVTNTLGHDFQEMFKGCTQLRAAPKLNITSLAADACYEMFDGCTNLMSGPEVNITSVGPRACQRMFADCTNLIQAGTFNITTMTGQYSYDIHHCEEMFINCTNLETCNMTIGAVKENAFTSCFENCTSLKNGITINCDTTAKNCYKNMFKGCTSLKLFSNLPASAIAASAYESMFEGCTSLTGIGQLNATSVTYTRALARMFAGCTSLQVSPVIKIKSLNQGGCLEGMFNGCTSLNYITALFLTDPQSSGNYPWTYNWVLDVSSTGTFIQATDATWMRTGIHAIPTNWVVSTYDQNTTGNITSIDLNGNTVTIVASNDDAVYYQINSTSDSGWVLYTGPFEIASSCTMNARCKNSEGDWGTIKTETLTIGEYPLKFVNSSNSITITYNPAANYGAVTYRVLDDNGDVMQGWTNYSGPFDAFAIWAQNYTDGDSLDITVEAKATKVNGSPTDIYTFDTTLGIEPPRAWVDGMTVRMSTETPGAVIEYYDNGEWKEWTDRVIYGVTEFTVRCTLHTNDGDMHSEEKTVELRPNQVDVSEPVVSWYDRDNNILQITADEGCTIIYNRAYNGTFTGYITYNGPFAITATCDIKAIAIDRYGQESDEVQYHFVYNNAGSGGGETPVIETVATPVITFSNPVVIITCTTSGATIYYSYDNLSWGTYSSPVTLSENATVYAKATKSGMNDSSVASRYCEVGADVNKYLTFTAQQPSKIAITRTGYRTPVIYYSINGADYQELIMTYRQSDYTIVNDINAIDLNSGDIITFYGNNEFAYNMQFHMSGLISASGNIMSLISNTLPTVIPTSGCFNRLFAGCTSLTTAPALPATTLADGCYASMFSGCTSLTTAPALPATTLAEYCYYKMFSRCTSLTTVPALPATTLAERCCWEMFYECTSLTTAPALHATTLAECCYEHMFSGCTSLTTVPALPATTLAECCYYNMFSRCTSLTTAPELLATTVADYCCFGMFSGCTSLTTAPELLATTLAEYCYEGMFYGCTSLTTVPALPATTLAECCYYNMFEGCTSLTTAPELLATTLAYHCCWEMFYGCTSLTTVPALHATTLADYCCLEMFKGCTSLTTAPALPATTLAIGCYGSMFEGCTSLTTAPALPATTLANGCYGEMFRECTSLTTAPALPATTLANGCYYRMFRECTSLTTAPELLATTLASNCYDEMFFLCNNLNYVKCLAIEPRVDSWLASVAVTGTFVKASGSTWERGWSGIPYGWTVLTV